MPAARVPVSRQISLMRMVDDGLFPRIFRDSGVPTDRCCERSSRDRPNSNDEALSEYAGQLVFKSLNESCHSTVYLLAWMI